jgi:hypothetical protein
MAQNSEFFRELSATVSMDTTNSITPTKPEPVSSVTPNVSLVQCLPLPAFLATPKGTEFQEWAVMEYRPVSVSQATTQHLTVHASNPTVTQIPSVPSANRVSTFVYSASLQRTE